MKDIISRMFSHAGAALKRSIAPYSGVRVGAALLSGDGRIFSGCNVENPSLMLSECAEKVAILKAISEGVDNITAILIVSNRDDYCYPCGACRQIIFEFAKDADIYIVGRKGIKKYTIAELLPLAFRK